MHSAKIENEVVVNVIVGHLPGFIECGEEVSIGWGYKGGKFIVPLPPKDTRSYREKREGEYASIGDQLDAIWKGMKIRQDNGEVLPLPESEMLDKILSVKAKFPKPVK